MSEERRHQPYTPWRFERRGIGASPAALGALCSLGAGAIHFAVAPEHFQEWWGYGLFFLAVGLFQGLYALALIRTQVSSATNPEAWGLALSLIGIFVNLLVIGLYLVSRTAGVPWLGPEAGVVEEVGVLDATSKALELTVVAILIRFVLQHRFRPNYLGAAT